MEDPHFGQQGASGAFDTDTRQRAIDAYKRQVSAGETPSLFGLATELSVPEAELTQHFGTVDAVGRAAWAQLAERVTAQLEASDAYRGYGARERILAYNFSFFELAAADRTFIGKTYCRHGLLADYRAAYRRFATEVVQDGVATDEIRARLGLDSTYPSLLLGVHQRLIHYWLRDESPQFADTEKAVEIQHQLPLEFMGRNLLDSIYDTVKFELGQLKLDRLFDDLTREFKR